MKDLLALIASWALAIVLTACLVFSGELAPSDLIYGRGA